jgi:glycosyltransferase involved in cell wall biosynthesis
MSPDLSLVLACYNEESILERSIDEIFRVLDSLRWTSEVILIDDASRDGTGRIIDRILLDNPKRGLFKLEHVQNVGRGGTVSEGFRKARGRFVGFIDTDLEVRRDTSCRASLRSNRATMSRPPCACVSFVSARSIVTS